VLCSCCSVRSGGGGRGAESHGLVCRVGCIAELARNVAHPGREGSEGRVAPLSERVALLGIISILKNLSGHLASAQLGASPYHAAPVFRLRSFVSVWATEQANKVAEILSRTQELMMQHVNDIDASRSWRMLMLVADGTVAKVPCAPSWRRPSNTPARPRRPCVKTYNQPWFLRKKRPLVSC
jgi:hypothetical protein